MKNDDSFVSAGEVIQTLIENIMPEDVKEYRALYTGWEHIVGKEISYHVEPKDIVNESLILEADHPGWVMRIRMMQKEILRDINRKYPELNIKRLSLRTTARQRKIENSENQV